MAAIPAVNATENRPARRQWVAILLVVGGLAWFSYAPILHAWFRHDDFWWLATARHWADGSWSLAYAPAGVAPLYNALYYLTYTTWGLNPLPYFALLLGCHVANTCLVVALVWLLTRRLVAGAAAGIFFAVLFSHHEAVAWPAGGTHVFVACSVLLAAICWVLYRRGWRWGALAAVAFALIAALTKDSGIAVVPVLLALDVTMFPRTGRRPLLALALPLFAPFAWRLMMPPVQEPMPASLGQYHLGLHMLTNLLWAPPQMLVPDLSFENYAALLQAVFAPGVAEVLAMVARALMLALSALALVGLWRGSKQVRLGVLWCYVGFLPFVAFTYDYARAPRYLYIPSLGLALLTGWGASVVAGRLRTRPLCQVLAVAVVVAYIAGSVGFARLVCANRLRDSALRQEIVGTIRQHVPNPAPGSLIVVRGLAEYLTDVAQAVPLFYQQPVQVVVGANAPATDAYLFVFDVRDRVRLVMFRPPAPSTLLPARASGHRPP